MARPQLQNLAPTISGLTTPVFGVDAVPSVTLGNPELSPFRAENSDLSSEWYFPEGGLLSVAVFRKEVYQLPADGFVTPQRCRKSCRRISMRRRSRR